MDVSLPAVRRNTGKMHPLSFSLFLHEHIRPVAWPMPWDGILPGRSHEIRTVPWAILEA